MMTSARRFGAGRVILLSLAVLAGASSPAWGVVRYVKADAAPEGNGDTWATAYTDLQAALAEAVSGDEIWVARGTYKPAGPGGDRTATFPLKNGVGVYGGFAGTETQLADRPAFPRASPDPNETTLSGDLAGDDGLNFAGNDENSYHVVTGSGTNSTAILDGFTIRAGNSTTTSNSGAGILNYQGSPTLTNCTFSENLAVYGGGIWNVYGSPSLAHCTFTGNTAYYEGGGMANSYGSPTLTGCTFSGNSASSGLGGGLSNLAGSPSLVNCMFVGNSCASYGAGLNDSFGNPTLTNCIFAGNVAGFGGGGMRTYASSPTLTNCILWGDSAASGPEISGAATVTFSCVQSGWAGSGNISNDPLFVRNPSPGPDGKWGTPDDDYGDLHLRPPSPCIDTGSNAAVPAGIATDLDGGPRIFDATGKGVAVVDMGAYELPTPISSYTLTASVAGGHGIVVPPTGTYRQGTVVTLTATPDCAYFFTSWTGTDNDNSHAATNTVTMNSNKTVIVEFSEAQPPDEGPPRLPLRAWVARYTGALGVSDVLRVRPKTRFFMLRRSASR